MKPSIKVIKVAGCMNSWGGGSTSTSTVSPGGH